MHAAATSHTAPNEVTILARILGNEQGQLSRRMAQHILSLHFNDDNKARMHDLVVRNQRDGLSPSEKEALLAYGKAGSLLSILKSKARKALRIQPKKRTSS